MDREGLLTILGLQDARFHNMCVENVKLRVNDWPGNTTAWVIMMVIASTRLPGRVCPAQSDGPALRARPASPAIRLASLPRVGVAVGRQPRAPPMIVGCAGCAPPFPRYKDITYMMCVYSLESQIAVHTQHTCPGASQPASW